MTNNIDAHMSFSNPQSAMRMAAILAITAIYIATMSISGHDRLAARLMSSPPCLSY